MMGGGMDPFGAFGGDPFANPGGGGGGFSSFSSFSSSSGGPSQATRTSVTTRTVNGQTVRVTETSTRRPDGTWETTRREDSGNGGGMGMLGGGGGAFGGSPFGRLGF